MHAEITELDARALYFVSYDGLVNTASFQREGLLTRAGRQYAVWYAADRTAKLARRELPGGAWESVALPHALSVDDSHNVVCLGISPADGRLHVMMDSHSSGFTYVAVDGDRIGRPAATLGGLELTGAFTYPQFLVTPEGRLQMAYRIGVSGDGQAALAEYDVDETGRGTWTDLGPWSSNQGTYSTLYGSSRTRNLYLHGMDYGPDATLHVFGTWREGDASVLRDSKARGLTNHDIVYLRSKDRGRTWRNAASEVVGACGTRPVGVHARGIVALPLGPDHALMNQESQAVDSEGRPHALVSYIPPDLRPATADYAIGRALHAWVHHLWLGHDGIWNSAALPIPPHSTQRTALLFDRRDTAYAVLPFGRVLAATAAASWSDWRLVFDGPGAGLGAFGEVVVDRTRLAHDNVLSFMYQRFSEGSAPSALRVLDLELDAPY